MHWQRRNTFSADVIAALIAAATACHNSSGVQVTATDNSRSPKENQSVWRLSVVVVELAVAVVAVHCQVQRP